LQLAHLIEQLGQVSIELFGFAPNRGPRDPRRLFLTFT